VIPIVLLGTIAGGVIAFILARHLFGDLLQRKLDERPRLRMIANAIDTEGWRMFGPSSILVTSPTVV
jgi:uncharacterized membrane protein YdjX (TVP38/TMEM64 family)